MAYVIFDGKAYENTKAVKFSESPSYVFYDTNLTNSEAAAASDIKQGKKAWVNGALVTGTHADVASKTKTKNIINNGTYYASDDDCEGYSAVTVNVKSPQSDFNPQDVKTVMLGTKEGDIEPSPPYTHMTKVHYTVDSTVDSNIKPNNIRNGVSILGITGNYEGDAGTITALYINFPSGISYSTSANFDVYFSDPAINADNFTEFNVTCKRKSTSGSTWSTASVSSNNWDSEKNCLRFKVTFGTSTGYYYRIQLSRLESGDEHVYFYIEFDKSITDLKNDGVDSTYWIPCRNTTGYTYVLGEKTQSRPIFGAQNCITGTFTVKESDVIEGNANYPQRGMIQVPTDKFAKCLCVYAVDDTTGTEDQGAPLLLFIQCADETPTASSRAIYMLRCKSGTAATNWNSLINNDVYRNDNSFYSAANSATYIVWIRNRYVEFHTYGTYAFRAGKTYKYFIYT